MADKPVEIGVQVEGGTEAIAAIQAVDAQVDALRRKQALEARNAAVEANQVGPRDEEGAARVRASQAASWAAFHEQLEGLSDGEKVERFSQRLRGAGEGFVDFNRKGEMAVKSVLAQINPALARSADLIFDITEGAGRMSGALLAVGATGAALGVLAMAFQWASRQAAELAERIQRSDERRREQRDEGLTAREDLFGSFQQAGVIANAAAQDEALRRIRALQERGVDRGTAIAAETARARGGLSDADAELALRGIAGGAAPALTGGAGDAAAIAKTIEAGKGGRGQAALDALIAARGERARREGVQISSDELERQKQKREEELDTEAVRLKQSRPDLSDEEVEAGRAIAGDPNRAFKGASARAREVAENLRGAVDENERTRQANAGVDFDAFPQPTPQAPPVIQNITINNNVDKQYRGLPGMGERSVQSMAEAGITVDGS